MKKLMLVIICISLIACSIMFAYQIFKNNSIIINDEKKTSDIVLKNILEAIQTNNIEQLISQFSKSTLDDVDNIYLKANELFDYFNGDVVSYNDWLGGPYVETSKDDKYVFQLMESTYDIKTTKCDYRLAISYVTKDTENNDNIGLHSLYIIKLEDDLNPDLAYWGDNKFTPGIQIGIKNT